MKASEMTNEDLYDELWLIIYDDYFDSQDHERSVLEESAERLRKMGDRNTASTMAAETDLRIAKLRAKLKVAEDALKWCIEQANEIGEDALGNIDSCALSMSMAGCLRRCERALAAIREEGGAK